MKTPVSDIAFTPAVKDIQERKGSRKSYAGMDARGGWKDVVTEDLKKFLSQQDTIFLGTATAGGRMSRLRRPMVRDLQSIERSYP